MSTDTFRQLIIALTLLSASAVVLLGGFSWIFDGTNIGRIFDSIARPVLLLLFSVMILLVSGGMMSFALTVLWTLILS